MSDKKAIIGDLGNVIEAHRFGGRRSDFFHQKIRAG
jgi:hypothetical protein